MILITPFKPVILTAIFIGLLFPAQPTTAQTRFTLSEIDNGYILLDQETGLISICTKNATELTCAASPDDQPLSLDKPSDDNVGTVKNLHYYFNQLFSVEFQASSSAFFSELKKRLYDMVDILKTQIKEPRA